MSVIEEISQTAVDSQEVIRVLTASGPSPSTDQILEHFKAETAQVRTIADLLEITPLEARELAANVRTSFANRVSLPELLEAARDLQ
jgi:hypothetical protein